MQSAVETVDSVLPMTNFSIFAVGDVFECEGEAFSDVELSVENIDSEIFFFPRSWPY